MCIDEHRQQRSIYSRLFTPGCNSSPSARLKRQHHQRTYINTKQIQAVGCVTTIWLPIINRFVTFWLQKPILGTHWETPETPVFMGERHPEKIQGTRKAKDSEFGSCFKTPQSGRRLVRRFSPLTRPVQGESVTSRGPYEFESNIKNHKKERRYWL